MLVVITRRVQCDTALINFGQRGGGVTVLLNLSYIQVAVARLEDKQAEALNVVAT